jgi:hypothetical protein
MPSPGRDVLDALESLDVLESLDALLAEEVVSLLLLPQAVSRDMDMTRARNSANAFFMMHPP